MHTMFDL